MANRVAIYRQDYVLAAVNRWWKHSTGYMDYPKRECEFGYLFREYTRFIADDSDSDMRCIVEPADFSRCLYALGILDVTTQGVPAQAVYKQLAEWKPSLDQIKRHELESLYEQNRGY